MAAKDTRTDVNSKYPSWLWPRWVMHTYSVKQMKKLLKGPLEISFKTSTGVEKIYTVELKKIDGRWRAWIDFEIGGRLERVGSCPLCGNDVIENRLGFGCCEWKNGCEFTIFKNSLKRFGGKMLQRQKAIELLKKGETDVFIKGFDGSKRRVRLYFDEEYVCRLDFG